MADLPYHFCGRIFQLLHFFADKQGNETRSERFDLGDVSECVCDTVYYGDSHIFRAVFQGQTGGAAAFVVFNRVDGIFGAEKYAGELRKKE